jgi:hypothetical protein
MTRDEWITVGLIIAFAALVTAQVTIVVGLFARPPRWRALAAAIAPPLAPALGMRAGMPGRAVTWIVSAIGYAFLRWLASR